MYREEHKPARKIQRTYIVLELYKYCVLLKDDAIGNKAVAFVGTSGVQMGWFASQADMLAEDWKFAEE